MLRRKRRKGFYTFCPARRTRWLRKRHPISRPTVLTPEDQFSRKPSEPWSKVYQLSLSFRGRLKLNGTVPKTSDARGGHTCGRGRLNTEIGRASCRDSV